MSQPVIATTTVGGSPHKVVIQANRNGFLYVLDAKDGKLIAANPFGKLNWASGIDLETGRPMVTDVVTGALEGKNVTVWPSVNGVTNWQHMSFSPLTGTLYINTIHVGMTYEVGARRELAPLLRGQVFEGEIECDRHIVLPPSRYHKGRGV